MQFLDSIRDYIKEMDESEYYKYFGAFIGALLLLIGLLSYFHYSRVRAYKSDLKMLETQRKQTQKILADYKSVTAQKEKVEDILAQNKDFRIGEAYQTVLEKLGLMLRQTDKTAPTEGETISGKTEIYVSSHLNGLSMKQLTDLLFQIANIPQMYVKDLVIKKNPTMPAVDVDITVATLESPVE